VKIDRFLAKPKKVIIGGEEFEINPFTIDDMPTLTKMGSKDSKISSEGIIEAVFKVFKQIDPECTIEQVKGISVEYLTDIMNAIGSVNDLDVEEAKKKLLEKK